MLTPTGTMPDLAADVAADIATLGPVFDVLDKITEGNLFRVRLHFNTRQLVNLGVLEPTTIGRWTPAFQPGRVLRAAIDRECRNCGLYIPPERASEERPYCGAVKPFSR